MPEACAFNDIGNLVYVSESPSQLYELETKRISKWLLCTYRIVCQKIYIE